MRGQGYRRSRSTSDDPPTFYADVLPILQESCQVCHRPGGTNLGGMIAPMSPVTYEETRPWAPMIAHAVAEGQMPPWHAHPRHLGTFRNERYLTDEQKLTIGTPDLVVTFDEPFLVGDHVHDVYENIPVFISEQDVPEYRWIRASEVIAGSHAVHHVISDHRRDGLRVHGLHLGGTAEHRGGRAALAGAHRPVRRPIPEPPQVPQKVACTLSSGRGGSR